MSEQTSIICRIEKDLKNAFEHVARNRDLTVSQMIRAYIRHEVEKDAKENTQTDLFKTHTPKPAPEKKQKKEKGAIPQGKKGLLDMFKGK